MRLEVDWTCLEYKPPQRWRAFAYRPGELASLAGGEGATLGEAVGRAVEEAVRLHVQGAKPMQKDKAGLTREDADAG